MRLDEKKHKIKTLRKLNRRSTDLGYAKYLMDWVPVDEPQFIGWETTVTLSEAALRRDDAHILIDVLSLTRMDKPNFTKDLSIVKLIRRNNKRYIKISADWMENQRRIIKDRYWSSNYLPYAIADYHERFISNDKFLKLDERHRKYFDSKETHYPATSWRNEFYEIKHRLGGAFPKHELRVKLTKAYSTHRGIPRGENISELDYISNVLDKEHYWCAKFGTAGRRRSKSTYDKLDNRKYRRKVNKLNHVVKLVVTSDDSDELIEKYEGKINLKRDRSWW